MKGFDHVSGKILKIDDANIYFEETGITEGPVLLFLHGGLTNIEDFNHIIGVLQHHYRILGIDNRGHGKSTLGSKDLSYALFQHDIEQVLDYLKINTLSIVGFSNGGTVAYRIAASQKYNIDKLVTIGSPWNNQHIEHLRQSYTQLTCDIWKTMCPRDYERFKTLSPDADIDKIFSQVMNMALDTSKNSRPNDLVKNISSQLLIIRGENDPILSESDITELESLVENSQTLSIPSAGHEAFLDQPKVFEKNMIEFFKITS